MKNGDFFIGPPHPKISSLQGENCDLTQVTLVTATSSVFLEICFFETGKSEWSICVGVTVYRVKKQPMSVETRSILGNAKKRNKQLLEKEKRSRLKYIPRL